MEVQRKLLIGYDLCDDFAQISCYSYKSFEPISICPTDKEEDCLIPVDLCIKNDTKLWVYGSEAVSCALNGNGILADHLLTKLKNSEETIIDDQKFTGVELLEKFLRKSLTLVKKYFPTETITELVITVREMEPKIVDGIYEALNLLGIEKDRAAVMSHASAYMYYALSQEKSLWLNDVGLFDFSEHDLSFYQINVNRTANPVVAGMVKKDFTDTLNYPMLKQKDLNIAFTFQNIAENVLYKQIISTLYFTGKGFEGGWAEDAIKKLCMGRRVFVGQNLYTKGACYAAKELSGDSVLGDVILLNNEMLRSSVWIKVYSDAMSKEILLCEAATPWYEVNRDIEVIPDNTAELEIILKYIMTREVRKEKITINNLPDRPNRMTRLGINIKCSDRSTIQLKITDLGFGDIYPQTGQEWEFTMDI